MTRSTWKQMILGTMAIGLITLGASQADAGWHGRPWLLGYGIGAPFSCYDPCCVGPVRRLLSDPCGWCPRCCWSVCCCDPCSVPAIDCGVPTAPVLSPTPAGPVVAPLGPAPLPTEAPKPPKAAEPAKPAEKPAPAETKKPNNYNPPPPSPEPGTRTMRSPAPDSSVLLTISVPADARVMINGRPTQSTGVQREYVSHDLVPGLTYKYEVCAQVTRNGKTLEKTKVVFLTAGTQEGIAFHFNPKPEAQVASAN